MASCSQNAIKWWIIVKGNVYILQFYFDLKFCYLKLLKENVQLLKTATINTVIYKASKHILEPRAFISMHFSLILCPWKLFKHVLNKSFQNQQTNTDIFNPVTVNSRITCFISFSWKLGKHAWNTCLNNSRIRRIWCLWKIIKNKRSFSDTEPIYFPPNRT